MAFLFGSGGNNAKSAPALTQMAVQTSVYGLPIPLYFGTSREAGNLLGYGDFHSVTVNNPSSGGGKGGLMGGGGKGGGGGQTTNYFATFAYGLCRGQITDVYNTWVSQTLKAGITDFNLFDGAFGQATWGLSGLDFTHIPYSGIAYLGAQKYNLGNSANIPSLNFEGGWLLAGTAPGTYGGNGCQNGGDADPSLVVDFLLTDPDDGAGFATTEVGEVANNDEAHTIPGAPYKITVTNPFLFNVNVKIASDLATCVSASPAAGQYAFNASTGQYTFAAADSGKAVNIRYASIGPLQAYQDFTLASGLWISPSYTAQASAASMLDEILKLTYSDCVWSSGVLTIVPRGVNAITAHGHTFTPNITPEFDLNYDDMVDTGNDPVTIERQDTLDQLNTIILECKDRANQYAPAIADAVDMAHRTQWGMRSNGSQTAHMFCDLNAAFTSAYLQLQDQWISNTFRFNLDARYVLLDPMSIQTVTDPNLPGITAIPVRILQIDEDDQGGFDITAEQYPVNAGLPAQYTLHQGEGFAADFDASAGDVNAPFVFGIPAAVALNQGLEMGVAISGSDPDLFGGCQIWAASDSGGPYQLIGELGGASRMGELTANFPIGLDPDGVNTLAVDLSQSDGELDSGTTVDADQNNSLCYIGGADGPEWVAFSAATLTSAFHYDLDTYIRRGQQGSAIVGHLIGDPFVRIDALLFRIPYQAAQVGQTMYLKILSKNIYGAGLQALADVTPYTVVLGGPPLPPAVPNFAVVQSGSNVLLTWTDIDLLSVAGYDLYYMPHGATFDPATATLISRKSRITAMTSAQIAPADLDFVIVARDIAGQIGPASTVHLTVAGGTPLFPITRSWSGNIDSDLAGTDTVPVGAASIRIILTGPGGSGSSGDETSYWGAGGGAGGVNDTTYPLTPAFDNGATITWGLGGSGIGVTGNKVSGHTGVNSSVTATLHAGTINVGAHAGQGGQDTGSAANGGTGGTAAVSGSATPTSTSTTTGGAGSNGAAGYGGPGGTNSNGNGSGGDGSMGGPDYGGSSGDGAVSVLTIIYNS